MGRFVTVGQDKQLIGLVWVCPLLSIICVDGNGVIHFGERCNRKITQRRLSPPIFAGQFPLLLSRQDRLPTPRQLCPECAGVL